jgi:septum formation protein
MWPLPIVLASASPRRRVLIAYIADNLSFDSANIDETPEHNESAHDLVERLACGKAASVAKRHNNALVIGSDTVVAVNNIILGKPNDYTDFLRMMALLSDTQHQVYTAVSVINTATNSMVKQVLTSDVNMAKISSQDAVDYWQTGEPFDKAGGYAIQGIGGRYVKSLNGSISAVIGLPIYETKQLLTQAIE